MKRYSFQTQLAILQQAEYDWSIYSQWLKIERSEKLTKQLQSLQPEKRTFKLRFIGLLARVIKPVLGSKTALWLGLQSWKLFEKSALFYYRSRAKHKLAKLQKRGLKVVVIAGSYGKTSTKKIAQHLLSHRFFTLATPASYNTPLAIARTVLKSLNNDHQVLILELGEYQIGDLDDFLNWIKPDLGILTPIGMTHSSRWRSTQQATQIFAPLLTHRHAPPVLIVADQNKNLIQTQTKNSSKIIYYGLDENSDYHLLNLDSNFDSTQGLLETKDQQIALTSRLFGFSNLINSLAGSALSQELGLKPNFAALRYLPNIERRLEVKRYQNTIIVDNSYNSSPGSWQEAYQLIKHLKLEKLAIVTTGFVELHPEINQVEHSKLADNLIEIASVVGVIQSSTNQDLITQLKKQQTDNKKSQFELIVGLSQTEVLKKLSGSEKQINVIWLEGGVREIYQ